MKNMPNMLVGMLLTGIVDQDVEPAELVDRLRHRAIAKRLVADVAGDRDCAPAFLADNLRGLGGIVMLAQIKNRDVRAFAREQGGDSATDAAVRASDQRDFAVQPP
jgi:hypothetical protein